MGLKRIMTEDEQRFLNGVRNSNNSEQVLSIIASALRLECVLYLSLEYTLYADEDSLAALFQLRKSLEGIWGHELPEIGEDSSWD